MNLQTVITTYVVYTQHAPTTSKVVLQHYGCEKPEDDSSRCVRKKPIIEIYFVGPCICFHPIPKRVNFNFSGKYKNYVKFYDSLKVSIIQPK